MASFLILAAAVASAQVVVPASEPRHTVSFTAEESGSVAPDQVEVYLTVAAQANTPREAMTNQAEKMKRVSAALREVCGDKNVATLDYSVGVERKYNRDTEEYKLVGYSATQQVKARAPIGKTADLLEAVVADAMIDKIGFTRSNADELREGLVNIAITKAKALALERAGRLGIRLGENPIGYSEGRNSASVGRVAGAAARAAPDLPSGELTLKVSVTLTYEILR